MIHHDIVLGISGSGANVGLCMSLDAVHICSAVFIQEVDVDPVHWDVNHMIPSTLLNTIPSPFHKDDESFGGTIEFEINGCDYLLVCLASC